MVLSNLHGECRTASLLGRSVVFHLKVGIEINSISALDSSVLLSEVAGVGVDSEISSDFVSSSTLVSGRLQ
jgi:hypothetical protein